MADVNNKANDVAIWNDAYTKSVSVITDGATERLAVDIQGGTFQLQPFPPKLTFNSAGVTVTSVAWVSLLNVSGISGKLDFIACSAGTSGYRIRLTVDSVVIYNVTMSELSSIGLSAGVNVPIWTETADKNFRYHPQESVDFNSSVLVEAQATGADVSLKYLITYREQL